MLTVGREKLRYKMSVARLDIEGNKRSSRMIFPHHLGSQEVLAGVKVRVAFHQAFGC